MAKSTKTIAEQIRRALLEAEKDGITRYRIAQETGISQAMLSKIVHGKTVPTVAMAERILRAIGLRLTITKEKDT